MKSDNSLLVYNFVMDTRDPLLSHQHEAVNALAKNFNQITVVTGKVGDTDLAKNVKLISTNWIPGQSFRNLIKLSRISLPIIARGEFQRVFFHMADLQCALLSPLIRIRGRKQSLWYAHTFKSKYLVFAHYWINTLITSTPGSCPIKSKKVKSIGQAIDEMKFPTLSLDSLDLNRLVHIGRFDKSKNIDQLITSAKVMRKKYPKLELTIVGSPGNAESVNWSKNLVDLFDEDIKQGWLIFKPAIKRSEFSTELSKHGCFIHAYQGSLDKTLIESTMSRIPVVTINLEYVNIFGSWASFKLKDLESEYCSMRETSRAKLENELDRRLSIALKKHSLQNWLESISKELKS